MSNMNNFELHNKAQELSDTHSKYKLAKMVVEAQNEIANNKELIEELRRYVRAMLGVEL